MYIHFKNSPSLCKRITTTYIPYFYFLFSLNSRLVPALDLHRAVLLEVLVHVEGLEQQVRLVAHALA